MKKLLVSLLIGASIVTMGCKSNTNSQSITSKEQRNQYISELQKDKPDGYNPSEELTTNQKMEKVEKELKEKAKEIEKTYQDEYPDLFINFDVYYVGSGLPGTLFISNSISYIPKYKGDTKGEEILKDINNRKEELRDDYRKQFTTINNNILELLEENEVDTDFVDIIIIQYLQGETIYTMENGKDYNN